MAAPQRTSSVLSERIPDALPDYLLGVQGLRTVAALLVAVYHIWLGKVSGGVDVFFVVAGYFATTSLLKLQHQHTAVAALGRIGQYWLRTLRRIAPSTAVVILGTTIASLIWMPKSQWLYAIPHAVASSLGYENWQLIASGDDYLQQDLAASPFQQFWALSLQVQFYLVFPLLLLLAIWVARARGLRVRQTVLVVLLLTAVVSFLFALQATAQNQPAAYFNTFARGWEFMVGAILCLLLTRKPKQRVLASAYGWAGLIALLSLGAVVDVSALFPGWVALVPVAAAVAIIVSSAAEREPFILRTRPIVWFADSSFAFYLWHWPILVIYRYRFEADVGLRGGIAILVTAAVLAWLTLKLVESPVRSSSRLQKSVIATLVSVGLLFVPAAAAVSYWQDSLDKEQEQSENIDLETLSGDDLVPSLALAKTDHVDAYSNGCHQTNRASEVIECWSGSANGRFTIALVGGSHAVQWLDVVRRAAEAVDARVLSMTKSGCLFGDLANSPFSVDSSCVAWSANALQAVIEAKPDLVVTLATRQLAQGSNDVSPDAYKTYFRALAEQGIPVLGIRDNPRFSFDVPLCVETNGAKACAKPRSAFYADGAEFDFSDIDRFSFVDPVEEFCPDGVCEVVMNNILVYRDNHHLTRTWTMHGGTAVLDAIVDFFGGDKG